MRIHLSDYTGSHPGMPHAAGSSKTLIPINRTTRGHIPECLLHQILPKHWYLSTGLHAGIFQNASCSRIFQNIGTYQPDYTRTYSRMPPAAGSSKTLVPINLTTCGHIPECLLQQILPKHWYLSTRLHADIFQNASCSRFFQNMGTYLPDYMGTHSRMPPASGSSKGRSVPIYLFRPQS
jgi:hypothetical protein